MLLYDTRKFDIRTRVLDPSADAPCRIACDHFEQGELMDFDTVYAFGKEADVLTFEIEGVNLEALARLEQEGVKVFPSADTLRKIQNKGVQKQFYADNDIPTAPFSHFDSVKALISAVDAGEIEIPFVWKSCTGGYDGMGVQVVRDKEVLHTLTDVACIAEAMVDFKHELAVIVARSVSGEIRTYPVVEMEFHPEANQVEYVICPARIPEQIAAKAREVATRVSEAMGHVGLLAVELFRTQDDQILVNEVAPRPHNSGHYSIEASYTNQFEQHLRAILDLPLGNTDSKVGGVMVNLVGAEGHTGEVVYEHIEKIMAMDGVTPHIYGKKQTRPFRKMGHVTIVDSDLGKARERAEVVKKSIRVISKK
jgi:5-(carboxyamino)imidazole ribonucleotide synthase